MANDEIKVGRPSLGITRKVSVTLPGEDWEFIDKYFGSRSAFFRAVTVKALEENPMFKQLNKSNLN